MPIDILSENSTLALLADKVELQAKNLRNLTQILGEHWVRVESELVALKEEVTSFRSEAKTEFSIVRQDLTNFRLDLESFKKEMREEQARTRKILEEILSRLPR
jgi:hypothetical protein